MIKYSHFFCLTGFYNSYLISFFEGNNADAVDDVDDGGEDKAFGVET